ncbi:AMP-binding enzyme [Actinokineospora iranica]|uniref:AMP-binding enzyme n=1 Tax=Actinokineospora iranica TaxID=1271860 RepID=A0A1G6TQP1_9PSEU|nr:AMP-binding enzyme [Actinokineospora iranica]
MARMGGYAETHQRSRADRDGFWPAAARLVEWTRPPARARFAGVLAGLGVGKGDRVIVSMPMAPQAVVAMLACAVTSAPSPLSATRGWSTPSPRPAAARPSAKPCTA